MITFSSCTENNPDQKFKGTLPEKQKGKKNIHVYIPQVKILRAKKLNVPGKQKYHDPEWFLIYVQHH